MCVITRKNGDDIQTTATLEQLEQLINNWPQLIRFGDELVNKYEITRVKKVVMNDIDTYIAWITDAEMKKRLRDIVKERKAKWLDLSGVKHLMDIYSSRFNS
jgi:hypothetical protein